MELRGFVGKCPVSHSMLAFVTTTIRITNVRRCVFGLLGIAVLITTAASASAQQFGPSQRIAQPAYQATNLPDYASPYAGVENGYLAENAYGGYVPAYDRPGLPPALAGIQQVSNLSYVGASQPAPPSGAAPPAIAQTEIAPPGAAQVSAAQPDATGNCGPCASGPTACCCDPFWAHRTSFFGEWLYLRARNDGVANALPQNGIGPGAVPAGRVTSNSPTYQPEGFRIGVNYALNRCSSIYAAYTYFHSESNGSTFANPPLVVHSLVTLPQTGTAASDGVAALSHYDIRFQFADVGYRRLIAGGTNWYLNYAVGARYANLYQQFSQAQINGPTQTGVSTNVGMDAAGGRVGLLAARKVPNRGFYIYGSAFADILVGNFRANYMQVNNLAGVQGVALWQTYRPVPILEYELGAGWISPNGKWSFSGGYYFAAWFNVISPSTYINAVRTSNYGPLNAANNITFDGLVVRAQRLW